MLLLYRNRHIKENLLKGTSALEACCWGSVVLMMTLLQILPDKVNITFNNDNKGNRLWLFNFWRVAILNFVTSLLLPLLLETEVFF